MKKSFVLSAAGVCLLACLSAFARAQVAVPYEATTNDPPVYGPYNGVFLAGGEGLAK